MERYAIIDLGSNSVRMNIMHVSANGSYTLLDQAKEMVRLSEGMGEEKQLRPEPVRRTIDALKLMQRLSVAYGTTKVYALATAAVRSAANQGEFLEQVKRETGLDFKVLSGMEEAYYDYLGVINTIDVDSCLIVDIGGGSTELIWVENREVQESVSLPVGSVVLSETYMRKGGGGHAEAEKAVKALFRDIPWLRELKGLPVIGLGGVIRTIAKVQRNEKNLQALYLHNYRVECDYCEKLFKRILESEPDEIAGINGISKARADIMAGGILPIKLIMEMVRPDALTVSGNGLRDGWFFERYFQTSQMPPVVSDVLDHSLEVLTRRYEVNVEHAFKVRQLALKIFDVLSPVRGFSKDHRKLLYVSSLIHDIGMHVEYYDHHRHGYYLAMNSRLCGLTNPEIIACAYLVGMHRNEKLKVDLTPYQKVVSKREFKELSDLALLLCLGEKLDRSESGTVEDVAVETDESVVKLKLYSEREPRLEMTAAQSVAEKFESAYKKRLEIVYAGPSDGW